MPPQLYQKCAQFVLAKFDQILEWEQQTDHERDTRFSCADGRALWAGDQETEDAQGSAVL
jgi:hypothetical protein